MIRTFTEGSYILLRVLELTPTTLANFKPHYTRAVNMTMEAYGDYLREISYRASLQR